MTKPFAAVLAELRELADRTADYGLQGLTGKARLDSIANRLSDAHAAEVAEWRAQDVRRIAEAQGQQSARLAAEARAEAAERDAREAFGLLRKWAMEGSPQNATLSRETRAFLAQHAQVGGDNNG